MSFAACDVGSVRRATLAGCLAGAALLLCACGSTSSHHSAATTVPSTAPVTSAAAAAPSTTAKPTSATSAVAAGGGACYQGDWISTDYSQQVQGQHVAGGSGIHFAITPSQMSINFAGMQPVTVTGGSFSGQGIYLGQEQAPASFSSAGTFSLPVKGTSNVTFEGKAAGQSNYSPPIKVDGFPTGGISGTYTCSGSVMSLTVPTPQGPTTVTLARA